MFDKRSVWLIMFEIAAWTLPTDKRLICLFLHVGVLTFIINVRVGQHWFPRHDVTQLLIQYFDDVVEYVDAHDLSVLELVEL